MTSLTLIGRRWFQRSAGNTYHTVEILVDGKSVHKSEINYGYGSQYETTATEWLEANGYISLERSTQPLWQYCREVARVAYSSTAIDVSREKDL